MKLFDTPIHDLQRALDARLSRQQLLAANVANADTPGYVPRDLDFAGAMKDAQASAVPPSLSRTREGHLEVQGAPAARTGDHVVEVRDGKAGLDGNRVDLDRTLASLAENALQYGAASRAVAKKLALLRTVVTDGNA